jgi:hypothetical protein
MTNTSEGHWSIWDTLNLVGILAFFLSAILLVVGNVIQPNQLTPKGTIEQVQGKITSCRDEQAQIGKAHYLSVVDYAFTYSDHVYTGEIRSGYDCASGIYAVGQTTPIYFLKEDPTNSALRDTQLMTTQLSPLNIVALVCLGGAVLILLISVSRRR